MPVLEAMACGIPCVATDTGALHELLDDERGWLIPPAYTFRDVWGNSKRDMINTNSAMLALRAISHFPENTVKVVARALDDVRDRTWDIPVTQVHQKIQELFDVQK